uniref:Acyltransferase 3 domain-containing protein n=1 Tax=Chromera velia CCMP2878 TaxID=1169474 RepID=A0A0G4I1S0_9ALVE|eukprot:Cvel_1664.t1-p1 / transcript=Cvel_1664.t1 / gene=Cvel_1664 / organism=Chromera_velia_CCMP2878 / gene_product=hypothetical protein / transcript_product=hypothetical protein / location=Cvel_scaffold60:2218-3612(-) / protein_length=465 / sequence_SO=supercontig / SO=protein_coding / is_pseudo=false
MQKVAMTIWAAALTVAAIVAILLANVFAGFGISLSMILAAVLWTGVLLSTYVWAPAIPSGSDAESAVPEKPKNKPGGGRQVWVDSLKTFLMCLVVVGHSGVAFLGLGWYLTIGWYPNFYRAIGTAVFVLVKSFAVPLFFFISGTFAPSSCDKKGPSAFLKTLVWRMSLPFFVFTFIVDAGLNTAANSAFRDPPLPISYLPSLGVTWFLLWLMLFSSVYAHLEGPKMFMDLPSIGTLNLISFGVSVLQLGVDVTLGIFAASPAFMGMPLVGPGNGLHNALWYAGGTLAGRNGWLSDRLPRGMRTVSAGVAGVSAVLVFVAALLLLPENPVINVGGDPSLLFFLFVIVCQVLLAPAGICLGVLAIDLFQQLCTDQEGILNRLAPFSYGVFLLHSWVVVVITFSFIKIYEGATGTDISWPDGPGGSTTRLSNDGVLFGGFLYTAVLSLGASVLLTFLVRLIPGVKSFL